MQMELSSPAGVIVKYPGDSDEPRQSPAPLPFEPGASPEPKGEEVISGRVMLVRVGQPPLEDDGVADCSDRCAGRGHFGHVCWPATLRGVLGDARRCGGRRRSAFIASRQEVAIMGERSVTTHTIVVGSGRSLGWGETYLAGSSDAAVRAEFASRGNIADLRVIAGGSRLDRRLIARHERSTISDFRTTARQVANHFGTILGEFQIDS